jgi:arabinofuranosyltransferase
MRPTERILAVVAAILIAIQVWMFASAQVDDAYISYIYARNLARGAGLVYDRAGPAVEGYSNFLWTVLHAPATRLADPIVFSKVLGALLLLVNVWLTMAWARRLGASIPVLAALLVAASPGFIYWHFAGLEVPLVVTSLLTGFWMASRPPASGLRHQLLAALPWTVLALTRIDGILPGIVTAVAILVSSWRNRDRDTVRAVLRSAAIVAAAYALYTGWRLVTYGSVFPNTVHAKVATGTEHVSAGLVYVAMAIARHPWLLMLPFAARSLLQRAPDLRHVTLAVLAVLVVQVLLCLVVGGDWMPLHRFLVPVLPLAAGLVAAGCVPATQAAGARRSRLVAALAALAIVAGPVVYPFGGDPFRVLVYTQNTETGKCLGRTLRGLNRPELVTANGAAGAGPYFADVHNIDPGGLNDPHIARTRLPGSVPGAPVGHEKVDAAYVLSRRPDLLVFVNARSDIPGLTVGDVGMAFEPAFYAHYEPMTLEGSRHPVRAWLPRASEADVRELRYLVGLEPVPAPVGRAFRGDSSLRFVLYQRVDHAGGDPLHTAMAAIDAAAAAGDWASASALVDQSSSLLDGTGLGQVRAALAARYAALAGDRTRAAAELQRGFAMPGRFERHLRVLALVDPVLRPLVRTGH